MKKIIIVMVLLLSILNFNVIASDKVYFDNGNSNIYFNDDVLSLNDYESSTSGILDDYAIYINEPITIELNGNNTLNSNNGLYIGANVTIKGDGILTINYSNIGINVKDDCLLTITENTNLIVQTSNPLFNSAYLGPQINNQAYVLDENNKMAYHYDPEDENPCFYTNYENLDSPIPLSYLNIRPKTYADLNQIDITSTLYKENTSYINHNGLLLNGISDDETITYNESIKTYYVTIWNSFDRDNFASNFIEFIFNKSEWGKVIDYEVLEVKNFYKEKDVNKPFVVSNDRLSLSYIGAGDYSYTQYGEVDVVSNYFMFAARSSDNLIKLKVYGKDDDYRYINVTIKKEKQTNDDPIPFVIPNTGV